MITPGQMLAGRYKLGEQLGRGGMALVFSALDTTLDRQVAIKVLDPKYLADEEFVARFGLEVSSAAQLAHPSIVTTYDTGQFEGLPYLVMENLPGGTLRDRLKRTPQLPERQAIAIALSLARALAYAHSRGIVHRDIKPSNVLFTSDGIPKLSDFGIAKALAASEYTQTGQMVGSVAYSAPEVLEGGSATPASDIYSLGCLLYEMVCGKAPFDGDSPMAIALGHLRQAPQRPRALNPQLSTRVEALLLRCLEKTPSMRYGSVEELANELEKLQVSSPTDIRDALDTEQTMRRPVVRTTAPLPPQRGSDTNTPLIIALVFVAIAAIALGFVFGPQLLESFGGGKPALLQAPNLERMSISQATRAAQVLGLTVQVQGEEDSDSVPPNSILRQLPSPGVEVEKGGVIKVIVSKGQELVNVPDITEIPVERASSLLSGYGLRIGAQQGEEHHPTLPEGYILRQSPGAGQKSTKGSRVDYWLSLGPEAVEPPPPDTNTGPQPPDDGTNAGPDAPPPGDNPPPVAPDTE